MYLKKSTNSKTGRTHLSAVHGYWDPIKKVSRTKTIKTFGFVDELKKDFDDPISHFDKIVNNMNEEYEKEKIVSLDIPSNSLVDKNIQNRKNYGHIIFSKIYHELEIDRFLDNKRRHENFKFNSESIMRLLLFGRLFYPNSKKKTLELKNCFFDNFKFSLYDIYDCLDHFHNHSEELQRYMFKKSAPQYKRDTSLIYYDVTNFYFEIDKEDGFRMNGCSKENSKHPIVQLGLAVDNQAIPISYNMFPGNTHDSETYIPVMSKIKKEHKADKIIVVADKGLNSGDNIAFNTVLGDGYIFSKSVRGASEEMKNYILDESGYVEGNEYKRKSRVIPTTINVTSKKVGKKKTKKQFPLNQKQVVFYSEKYARRSKVKRDQLLAKATDLIANPSKYKKSNSYGAAGYVKNIQFDKNTGEVLTPADSLFLDMEKIKEDEKYDGYYLLVTSELDESDDNIIKQYHGLWRIEESFKITKSTLDARPVFLKKPEHINAHFLICFIALLFSRLVEIRLGNKYNVETILESLRKVECSHIAQNYYLFDFADDITDDMNAVFNAGIGKKIMSLGQIKKNLGLAKKV